MKKKDKQMYQRILEENDDHCLFCDSPAIERHHVFGGPFRDKSTKYGMIVPLCHEHHQQMIHGNVPWKEAKEKFYVSNPFNWTKKDDDTNIVLLLRREYQNIFEQKYPGLNFRKIFGRNYK